MIFGRSSLALVLSLLPAGSVRAMNGMKATSCENNGRKCAMDVSGFSLDSTPGEVSMMDLGPGRSYACTSKGAPMGREKAAYHAECMSVGEGSADGAVPGSMNAVLSGKNSDGEDLMFASMSVGGEVCRIGPDATGTSSGMECTPADEFPPEDDPREAQDHELGPPEDYEEFGERAEDHGRGGAGRSPAGLRGQRRDLQGNDVMDIMVVWTRKAECRSNGMPASCSLDELTTQTEANIRGLIDLAVFETNTAFDNSGVTAELRLVHAYREETYDESAGASAALEAITFPDDGIMDDIPAKRAMVGADLVALIGSDFTSMGLCGVAWLGSPPSVNWMFSVTDWSCATGVFTFGHEIGHNMGCFHDKGNQGDCGTTTDFRYGYQDPDSRYRTILATDCRSTPCSDQSRSAFCTRLQYYSNPDALADGSPLGNATIDNARRINSVSATIANFFDEVPVCTEDSDCDDSDPCTTNVCDGACIFDPIDCDDGDACTTDSCSAGTCVNTDISFTCDDGNPCTADDCNAVTGCFSTVDTSLSCDDGDDCTNESCSANGECVSTPVMGCCGNGICEEGEQGTCPADCFSGPFALRGPLCASCFGLEGNMFDVEARGNDITVTNFRIRYFQGSNVEVWTRQGTHNGFAFSSGGWTRIARHTISGASPFTMVEIPESSFTQSVQIAAGATQAFYVTLTLGDVIYHRVASSLNAIAAEDDNLIMYEGPAKLYPFSSQTGPRVFNGQILYKKGSAASAQDPVGLGPLIGADQKLEEEEGEEFMENVAVKRELVGEESVQ